MNKPFLTLCWFSWISSRRDYETLFGSTRIYKQAEDIDSFSSPEHDEKDEMYRTGTVQAVSVCGSVYSFDTCGGSFRRTL